MIHGHAVLEMMQDHTYTMEDLLKAIDEKFGADARFHTCHGGDMMAKELIHFFMGRGRIVPSGSSMNLPLPWSPIIARSLAISRISFGKFVYTNRSNKKNKL